jgi:hypothetical protein
MIMESTMATESRFNYFHGLAELQWTAAQYPEGSSDRAAWEAEINRLLRGKMWVFRDPRRNPVVQFRVRCKPQDVR